MLSRRYLRIKAMQTLYALSLSKKSNYSDAVERTFHSKGAETAGIGTFTREDFEKSLNEYKAGERLNIEEGIVQELELITRSDLADAKRMKSEMIRDAEKIFESYLMFLGLLIELISAEDKWYSSKEEKGKISGKKKLWKRVFASNRVFTKLKFDKTIESELIRKNSIHSELSRALMGWFKDFILTDELYSKASDKDTTFEQDMELARHLVKSVFFKNESIDKYFEEKFLHWAEDKAILKSMVDKTLKGITEESENVALAEFSYNWEDDKTYFEEIFDKTLKYEQILDGFIEAKSKNWEMDRIALLDRVILRMALAEMLYFPSVPVKVTINEYIEISKRYSTPKSRQFINGILDVLSKEWKDSGKMKKSGRGLLDNK